MRKRLLLLSIMTLSLLTVFLFTSCGNESEEIEIINPINVTISIDYPDKSGIDDIEDLALAVEENSTVLDMLQVYCTINNLPVSVETTSSYVQGINNVMEGDYGSRTWKYSINGEKSSVSPSEMTVENGDSVSWYFKSK